MAHTKMVVITGGPGTGKTSVIHLLRRKYPAMKESARLVLARNSLFRNKNAREAKGKAFQEAIWELEVKHYASALSIHAYYVFFDRGFFDGFAYSTLDRIVHLEDRIAQGHHIVYDAVFILDPLPRRFYEKDKKRAESYEEALRIHSLIAVMYRRYGYRPIRVPFSTAKKRAAFILQKLRKLHDQKNVRHHGLKAVVCRGARFIKDVSP